VWVLGMVHAIGSGTDAGTPWLRTLMIATGAPIVVLFAVRTLRRPRPRARSRLVVAEEAAR
jgi:hypothetical protein